MAIIKARERGRCPHCLTAVRFEEPEKGQFPTAKQGP